MVLENLSGFYVDHNSDVLEGVAAGQVCGFIMLDRVQEMEDALLL